MRAQLRQGQHRGRRGTAANATWLVLVAVGTGALAASAYVAGVELGLLVLLVPVVMMLLASAGEPSDKPSDEYPGSCDDHRYDEHDHGYHYRGRS